MINLAVFVSGKGGFFRFLLENLSLLPGVGVKVVLSDRQEPQLTDTARRFGLPLSHVTYKGRPREETDREIHDILSVAGADMIFLNYNKLLGPIVTQAFSDIYNLHLSLLPLHKGFGAIEAAHGENNLFYGVTLHRVDDSVDGGKVVAQVVIPKRADETVENMTANIFRYGCLLQLDALFRLSGGQGAPRALYDQGYFNPPLTVDAAKAEENYQRGMGRA